MDVMEDNLASAVHESLDVDICRDIVHIVVAFAEPLCVTSNIEPAADHSRPVAVCVDCGGLLCSLCFLGTRACRHALCQPCATKAARRCYGCNAHLVMCKRFCEIQLGQCDSRAKDFSPHVLCTTCILSEAYRCLDCDCDICPCYIDIHEMRHMNKRLRIAMQ